MKKIAIYFFIISMIVSMFGCNNPNDDISEFQSLSKTESKEQSFLNYSSVAESNDAVSLIDETSHSDKYSVNIYIPNSIDDDLCKAVKYRYDGTIEGLINKMIEVTALPKDTKLLSFKIEDKIAYIDLSKEYGDAMIGSMIELQYVTSLVNTIIDLYDDTGEVYRVRYTVEGKDLDRGHFLHDIPASFFNLSTHTPIFISKNEYKVVSYDGSIEDLVKKLADAKFIPEGTKVISFKLENNIGYVDLSKEFVDGMLNLENENKIIKSLVDTIIYSRRDIDYIKGIAITIDGKTLKTKNETYDSPIE